MGIILNEAMSTKVIYWEPVSSRIIRIDLQLEERISIIQIYAPTEDRDITEKEIFYISLQQTVEKAQEENKHVFIIGDWNARIGNDSRRSFGCMGKYGMERTRNGNGDRMLEFCIDNQLLIGNTFYPHKSIHQITFVSEERNVKSAIDYCVYTKNARYAVHDVRVFRGAELSTQHRLLIMSTEFKPPRNRKAPKFTKIKIEELE